MSITSSSQASTLKQGLLVLVDDNEMDNEFHQIVLRKASVTSPVRVFEDGRDFLEFLRQTDRSASCLVFLDINMPMLSGFEVLEQIRSEKLDHPGLNIFLLSSSSSPADLARAAGEPLVRGYFSKPLTAEMVATALGTVEAHERV